MPQVISTRSTALNLNSPVSHWEESDYQKECSMYYQDNFEVFLQRIEKALQESGHQLGNIRCTADLYRAKEWIQNHLKPKKKGSTRRRKSS